MSKTAKTKTKNVVKSEGAHKVALNKQRGALGGRGARTIAIENYIAKCGAKGATIAEIEENVEANAIRNHVHTLFAIKSLLRRDDDEGRYFMLSDKALKAQIAKLNSTKN